MNPDTGRTTARSVRGAALLLALVTGCAPVGEVVLPSDPEPREKTTERVEAWGARAYPWCDAPPSPEVDPEQRARMLDMSAKLKVPVHRLRQAGLRLQPDADELQAIEIDPERGVLAMAPEAGQAWILMQAAASADGIDLIPLSAYRSPRYQRMLIRERLADNEPMEKILQSSLPPGFSEHHTGDAIDIGTQEVPYVGTAFGDTEAFAWLRANAGRHCFELSYPEDNPYGLDFEPWHWRFARRAGH